MTGEHQVTALNAGPRPSWAFPGPLWTSAVDRIDVDGVPRGL
ncbi:MAG TPA: hypothetical protein VFE65_15870 [Pseudonocardia sp.]|nr:hypothetical protein [Pseudonocardia sp.]